MVNAYANESLESSSWITELFFKLLSSPQYESKSISVCSGKKNFQLINLKQ